MWVEQAGARSAPEHRPGDQCVRIVEGMPRKSFSLHTPAAPRTVELAVEGIELLSFGRELILKALNCLRGQFRIELFVGAHLSTLAQVG